MHRNFLRKVKKRAKRRYKDIDPEDIFLDSTNLPGFDEYSFEGRIEKPIGSHTFMWVKLFLVILLIFFISKLWSLQVSEGELFAEISEKNRLEESLIFANRGIIYDRNQVPLATNSIKEGASDFASRIYADFEGVAHVVGYVKYPSKDSKGFYYDEEYRGQAGAEKVYNDIIRGKNGLKLVETDALGKVTSEGVIERPVDGEALTLSIDAKLSDALYKAIKSVATERGFKGGAGVIMNVETGEVIALSSYPEYDQNVITLGTDNKEIGRLFNDPSTPFLDRVTSGLYTPGSIVKPIVALGALHEKIISPEKQILSTGSISLPNPYNPDNPSVFKDWKAHGWVDMRRAIGVSSDVYFYAVGGGFADQKGLGITNINKYFNLFGLAEKTGIDLPGEKNGVIATPAWKKENFDGDDWRIGDTYITAIGQYGTQVTPLEAVRWTAAIANSGKLLVPSILYGGKTQEDRIFRSLSFPESEWRIIREGMRQTVLPGGSSSGLNMPNVEIAAKTGTAELGVSKDLVNSWVTGFFPYDNPRYAFAVLMERGSTHNLVGASAVTRQVLDWVAQNKPEYFQ